MTFKVPLMVCPEDGQADAIQEIAIVEKDCQRIGQIGLSLAEAKALLQAVQQSIVERQTVAFWPRAHTARSVACRFGPRGNFAILPIRRLFGTITLQVYGSATARVHPTLRPPTVL